MLKLENKRLLITGVCGTVGSELLRKLLLDAGNQPEEIIGVDNNESEIFFLEQRHLTHTNLSFFIGDVRDQERMLRVTKGVDIVFHTAALKHVVLCERSPLEAVQSNIHGVQNIIFAAQENRIGQVVLTSSDKAVNPTNVMGTSKLMGERLVTAANSNQRKSSTIFSSTRFGNVLGSTGSVIPIFTKQISKGGPITLTDTNMTRFVMSIYEAVRLVIDSASLARGGEVFITKMPVIKIQDLAEVMIEQLARMYGYEPADISIEVIGTKPGEKLYEELMSQEETRRALELEHYFSVIPAFRGMYNDINYNYPGIISTRVDNPYISLNEKPMRKKELLEFLLNHRLLLGKADISDHPDQRYWPGDKQG